MNIDRLLKGLRDSIPLGMNTHDSPWSERILVRLDFVLAAIQAIQVAAVTWRPGVFKTLQQAQLDFERAEVEYASWDVSWLAHAPGPSAIDTLTAMGYTHHGGVRWAPPVGQFQGLQSEIANFQPDRHNFFCEDF